MIDPSGSESYLLCGRANHSDPEGDRNTNLHHGVSYQCLDELTQLTYPWGRWFS